MDTVLRLVEEIDGIRTRKHVIHFAAVDHAVTLELFNHDTVHLGIRELKDETSPSTLALLHCLPPVLRMEALTSQGIPITPGGWVGSPDQRPTAFGGNFNLPPSTHEHSISVLLRDGDLLGFGPCNIRIETLVEDEVQVDSSIPYNPTDEALANTDGSLHEEALATPTAEPLVPPSMLDTELSFSRSVLVASIPSRLIEETPTTSRFNDVLQPRGKVVAATIETGKSVRLDPLLDQTSMPAFSIKEESQVVQEFASPVTVHGDGEPNVCTEENNDNSSDGHARCIRLAEPETYSTAPAYTGASINSPQVTDLIVDQEAAQHPDHMFESEKSARHIEKSNDQLYSPLKDAEKVRLMPEMHCAAREDGIAPPGTSDMCSPKLDDNLPGVPFQSSYGGSSRGQAVPPSASISPTPYRGMKRKADVLAFSEQKSSQHNTEADTIPVRSKTLKLDDGIVVCIPSRVRTNSPTGSLLNTDSGTFKSRSPISATSRLSEVYSGLNPRVVFSNSTIPTMPSMLRFFKCQNGRQVNRVSQESFDILVVGTTPLKKTSKLLLSVALGKPIVTDSWIIQSAQAGKLLTTSSFAPQDRDLRNLGTADRRSLFRGRTFYITPALKKDYGQAYADIVALAEAGGAKQVISKPTRELGSDISDFVVLGLERGDLDVVSVMERGHPCYSKELLSTSILRSELDLNSDEFRIAPSGSPGKKKRGRPRKK